MRRSAGSNTLWRVLEVTGPEAGQVPSDAGFRLVAGGFDVETAAPSGVEAIANVRAERAPTRRVWLYAATCGRRATRSNPNGVLVPPLAEVEA